MQLVVLIYFHGTLLYTMCHNLDFSLTLAQWQFIKSKYGMKLHFLLSKLNIVLIVLNITNLFVVELFLCYVILHTIFQLFFLVGSNISFS